MDKVTAMTKRAIESTYGGLCTISEYVSYRDSETEELKPQLKPVHEDKPCKLSKKTINTSSKTDIASSITYATVLFIASDIEVKPGSKIKVNQHGVEREFEQSGEPFVYDTHQEIMLQRVGKT